MEKKIIIPDNHLMLGNSSEIKSLCDPLSTIGISSFDYERCYDNGKITSLGTDPEYLKNYYSQGVYVTVSELEEIHELHGRQNNYVFDFYSSSMAATDHLGSIENRKKHRLNLSLGETFNITNRIYFLIRQKGFYEIFGLLNIFLNVIVEPRRY